MRGRVGQVEREMKMIIACRRHPGLSRRAFFEHLRNVHWPLVQRYPAVLRLLGGYIQNHALGEASPGAAAAPFRPATDRDSVIELFFEGPEQLRRLATTPEYLEHIRPDEGRFNDLGANIMVMARPQTYFEAGQVGRCKRFDFIVRHPSMSPAGFADALAADARRLALDPRYTANVDRHVQNDPLPGEADEGFGKGAFDCVREVWASSYEALAAVAPISGIEGADREKSFCIFATEFVMKAPGR